MSSKEERKKTKRLDNAATIDFITSAAAVLAQEQLIENIDKERLRVDLTSLQYGDLTEDSLFLQLHQQDDDILNILFLRYGIVNTWRNLWRYTCKRQLLDFSLQLKTKGSQLLGRSDLWLNRYYQLNIAGQNQAQQLFADLVLDYGQILANAAHAIETAAQRIGLLIPANLLGEDQKQLRVVDQKLAAALDMCSFDDCALPFSLESEIKSCISAALTALAQNTNEFLQQLNVNLNDTEHLSYLRVLCENTNSRTSGFQALQLSKTVDLTSLEASRLEFIGQLTDLQNNWEIIVDKVNLVLSHVNHQSSLPAFNASSDNILRSIAFTMLSKGTPPLDAMKAARDLLTYCAQHQVAAAKLIPAELKKINPYLNDEALQRTILLTADQSKASSHTQSKELNRLRLQNLGQYFGGIAVCLSMLLVSAGCGVKTTPHSEYVDFRPPIEYHSAPKQKQKSADKPAEKKTMEKPQEETLP